MNNSKNLGLYAAVIAVSVGVLGAYGFNINPSSFSNAPSSATEATPILGHVTVTVTDPDGHIKQYIQGDNTVQINAKDCVGRALFGVNGTFGSTVCTNAMTTTFTHIALSSTTGGAGALIADNVDALAGEYAADGLTRINAASESSTWTDAPHSGSGTEVVQATFTNTDSASHVVGSAGLFNSTTVSGTGGMFAGQYVNPAASGAGVTLNQNDAITIKWTISVG